MLFSCSHIWNTAKEQTLKAFFFISASLFFLSLAYAAISWPSAPAGETTGGKYSTSLVPSGFVGAFNLATCPSGWKVADGTNSTPDMRGAFVRGMGGNANSRDVARTLGDYQDDAFQGHRHFMGSALPGLDNIVAFWDTDTTNSYAVGGATVASRGDVYAFVFDPKTDGVNGIPRTANETRSKNIALLYCQKN